MNNLDLNIETTMMIFFVIALIVSMYKLYVFLPNRTLPDDDQTKEATDRLISIMIRSIHLNYELTQTASTTSIYDSMIHDSEFNHEHFWRFNQNRLNHLIENYHLKFNTSTIEEIYHHSKRAKKL